MCGRAVTGDVNWEQYHEWMNLLREPDAPVKPNFNNAPTTMNPIFIPDGDGIQGVMARWGLIPNWFHKPLSEMKFSTFNARSEDAASKPTFRDAMRSQHCLVPAQGYYEWTGVKGNKTPYYISVLTNAPAFCFAGLYTEVKLPGFVGYSYTVLTEGSQDPIKGLHHRMPVIIDEGSYDDWLGSETALTNITRIESSRFSFHEVNAKVGNVRNNEPSLIAAV
ncbi:MAG: SOS response-associated peptidase [Paracoccaceae bacterium]|jgi:putative SOS response-associated peptidase YedK